MLGRPCTLFCLLFIVWLCWPNYVQSGLVSVQMISRHGIRAPNPVITTLCPLNAANIARYDHIGIDGGGLTGKGMTELYMLGRYTRHHYVKSQGKPSGILSDIYRSDEVYVMAVAEDRTIQSATAWGNGLFPHVSAPSDFASEQGLPPPLPVYSNPDGKDNLLESRKAQCKKQLAHDSDIWDAVHGPALWNVSPYAEALTQLGSICGVNLNSVWQGSGDNFGDAIKDITDNLWFDQLEGFYPLKGLNFELFSTVREIAVRQLKGRILGSNEQIVYLSGDLPQTMVNNFRESMKGGRKLFGFHGHREMMYAVAAFFNLEFNIPFPGLPYGEILPGGSLFIELHQRDDNANSGGAATSTSTQSGQTYASPQPGDENYFLRAYLWYPCYNASGVDGNPLRMGPLNDLAHCHNHQLTIADCKQFDCPLLQVLAFVENRLRVVKDDWKSLCPIPSTPAQLVNAVNVAPGSDSETRVVVSLFSFGFIFLVGFAAVVLLYLCIRYHQEKNEKNPKTGSINQSTEEPVHVVTVNEQTRLLQK